MPLERSKGRQMKRYPSFRDSREKLRAAGYYPRCTTCSCCSSANSGYDASSLSPAKEPWSKTLLLRHSIHRRAPVSGKPVREWMGLWGDVPGSTCTPLLRVRVQSTFSHSSCLRQASGGQVRYSGCMSTEIESARGCRPANCQSAAGASTQRPLGFSTLR